MTRPQDTSSEAWRAECEARDVANLPNRASRQIFLGLVEKHRGKPARLELERAARVIWEAEQGRATGTRP